jgi:predicted nucleic acid-binding protein
MVVRGLLFRSVVVVLDLVVVVRVPAESAISAVSLGVLAAATHATLDALVSARRQDRLQWAAQTWDALAFDVEAARAFARIAAAIRSTGRPARPRVADLLIASTAAANALPLYTRTPAAFAGLAEIVRVVAV